MQTIRKKHSKCDRKFKILVPNTMNVLLIGKAAAHIKQIKNESGLYVQNIKDITLQERCLTNIA